MQLRQSVAVVAAAVLGAALVAIGTREAGAQAASKAPIVIGTSASLSGSYAASAKYAVEGYELWVEHVNARGGLLGRPVKLVLYDDKSDPRTGAQLYEKLITQDRVDLIVGPYSSAVTSAVAAVAEKHKMAMLAPECSDSTVFERGYRYAFQGITTSDKYLIGALEIARAQGYKTAVLLYEDTSFPISVAKVMPDLVTRYGVKLLLSEKYPKGATDFSGIMTKVKRLNADVILAASYVPDSMGIMRSASELRVDARMFALTIGPAEKEFGGLGTTAEYVFGTTNWHKSLKTAGNEPFVKDYVARFNREPDYHSAANYANMQVLEAAVTRAGSLDQDRLTEAIRATEMDTVFGRFKVNEKGQQVGFTSFLLQWQKGTQVLVWPEVGATGAYILPTPPWKDR